MKRRERTRADEMAKRFNARKEHRNRQFMDEILDGIPEYVPASEGVYSSCSYIRSLSLLLTEALPFLRYLSGATKASRTTE